MGAPQMPSITNWPPTSKTRTWCRLVSSRSIAPRSAATRRNYRRETAQCGDPIAAPRQDEEHFQHDGWLPSDRPDLPDRGACGPEAAKSNCALILTKRDWSTEVGVNQLPFGFAADGRTNVWL